jgi:hypothetical protein
LILRGLMGVLLSTVEESAANIGSLIPDEEARVAFLELRNKVQAFRAFEHVDEMVSLPLSSPIGDLVARAVGLDAPVSVWAAEGIGYHVTAAGSRIFEVRRSDAHDNTCDLPHDALIPLHAGMGSALAATVLEDLNDRPSADILDDAVARFEDACTRGALPAYLDVSREALGFVVRSMYADLLPMMAIRIRVAHPGLRGLFWHGIGRAAYFSPSSALPLGRAREWVLEEAGTTTSTLERRNLVAGIAWAATLVNLPDPEALERWIAAIRTPDDFEPFAFGVQSAFQVWRQCAPRDPAYAAFAYHSRGRGFSGPWDRIMKPLELNARRPGELFQWRTAGTGARE